MHRSLLSAALSLSVLFSRRRVVMQTHMAKPILWPGVVVCAVVLGVVSLSRVSAGTNKVDICHYEEATDS